MDASEKYDFSTPEGIEKFLRDLSEEVAYENKTKRFWMLFLGRDYRDFMLEGKKIETSSKIVIKAAFCDAVEIFAKEPARERNFIREDQRIVFEMLRNAFLSALERLQKVHEGEKAMEILGGVTALIIDDVREGGYEVKCLEFIGLTLLELSQQKQTVT